MKDVSVSIARSVVVSVASYFIATAAIRWYDAKKKSSK